RRALDDELLAAGQDESIALPLGLERDALRSMARPLVDREREHRLAGEDAGVPALGMRAAVDRPGRRDRRRQERRGGEVAADFLEHQRRLGRAEAEPAMAFGDRDAGEAEFAELFPQVGAEPIAATAVAPVAQLLRDPALVGEEAGRGILQHLLVVGQQHVTLPAAAGCAWRRY